MVPLYGEVNMLLQKKVQINKEEWEILEQLVSCLNYKSKSEYIRQAIQEKIRRDKAQFRELKRQAAMKGYGDSDWDNSFEEIEGEDFEDR
jgi:Arc/MetJ-type ribon-helix-helix transcriptional regulator